MNTEGGDTMTSHENGNRQTSGRARGSAVKIVAGVAALAALLFAAKYFNVQELFRNLLAWIEGLGPLGPLVFILAYIAATVFFLPGSILTLGAGFVFGLVRGSIVVSVASTLGATAAFLVGRYLARGWVSKKVEGNEKFKAIDEAVGREGWKIVGLTRLSPVFPFNLLNYAFGLTKVSLGNYFFASWAGMIPGTIMYVYIGSLAGDLATLGSGGRSRTPQEWALYGLGFAATIAVTIFVTRIAKKALSQKV